MRRSFVALAAGLLLALAAALPAAASDMCESGRAYGSMHISMEAREGMLGKALHPGMHRGFAVCIR